MRPVFVLTYHSVYRVPPRDLAGWIHNVDPDTFRRQMRWCKENFDVVDLDALAYSPPSDSTGRVAVTFDDGNESVFATALPILAEMRIPATVFLTGSAMDGRPGWRDKVRYVITQGLRSEFAGFAGSALPLLDFGDDRAFFLSSKSAIYPGGRLEGLLDDFLERKGRLHRMPVHHRLPAAGLPCHPLVRYGNHSFSHYVLASLPNEEQEREITSMHVRLQAAGVDPSPWFAVPFGRPQDLGAAGLRSLGEWGYHGCLLCRNDPVIHSRSAGPAWNPHGLATLVRLLAPAMVGELAGALLDPGFPVRGTGRLPRPMPRALVARA